MRNPNSERGTRNQELAKRSASALPAAAATTGASLAATMRLSGAVAVLPLPLLRAVPLAKPGTLALPLPVPRRACAESRRAHSAALRPTALSGASTAPLAATTVAVAVDVSALMRGELRLLPLGRLPFRARQCCAD